MLFRSRTYFGCPVAFASERYALRFPAAVLSRPLADDGDVHALAQRYLSTIAVPTASATADTVAELVRHMLPTGTLDLDLVAGQLALHRRTLQRQLAEQGTSFAALVDQVRRDEAERYLRETDMPLGQLAGVLGLSPVGGLLDRQTGRLLDRRRGRGVLGIGLVLTANAAYALRIRDHEYRLPLGESAERRKHEDP